MAARRPARPDLVRRRPVRPGRRAHADRRSAHARLADDVRGALRGVGHRAAVHRARLLRLPRRQEALRRGREPAAQPRRRGAVGRSVRSDPSADTVCGIGNRKNEVFSRVLRAEGIAPYPGSVALLDELDAAGIPIAVVSSSKNAEEVLRVRRAPRSLPRRDGRRDRRARPPRVQARARRLRRGGADAGGRPGAQRRRRRRDQRRAVRRRRRFRRSSSASTAAPARTSCARPAPTSSSTTSPSSSRSPDPDPRREQPRRSPHDRSRPLPRRPVAPRRDQLLARRRRRHRDALLRRQRLPGPARQPPRGPASRTSTAPSSTGSTRRSRSATPSRRTASPRSARRSSTRPTRRSCASTSTTSRCRSTSPTCASTSASLDMRDGVLRRRIHWRTPSGKEVLIEDDRLVSFEEKHLAILRLEVTVLNADAPVTINCQLLNRQDGEDVYGGTPHAPPRRPDSTRARPSASTSACCSREEYWQDGGRSALSYRGHRLRDDASPSSPTTSIETENEYNARTPRSSPTSPRTCSACRRRPACRSGSPSS